MSIYTGGGYKSGTSQNPLRKWKHDMGLKTSAPMNSGIRNLWYSGYKPDKKFEPLVYGVKKPSKKPRVVSKVDRTLKMTPQPRISQIQEYKEEVPIIYKKLFKDKTKEEKEQDKMDKLRRADRALKAKEAANPDKRTKAYRDRLLDK
jgi:hypothetical protein